MSQTITILPLDQDPLAAHEGTQPWRQVWITATGLFPQQEFPNEFLEALSPGDLQKMAAIKAAGGVHRPTDPDEALAPEVYVSLIRHAEMTIEEADEIIIPAREATLRLVYPLSVVALVPVKAAAPEGITRGEALNAIHDAYKTIYAREDASSRPTPIDDREISLNRNETSGNFGIWGHDMSDLVVTSLLVRLIDGAYWIEPELES